MGNDHPCKKLPQHTNAPTLENCADENEISDTPNGSGLVQHQCVLKLRNATITHVI
jgi:hypothetical protein